MAQQTQQEELVGALSEDVFGAGIAKPEEEKALEVMEAQPTIAGSAMQTNGEIGPAAIIPEKTGGAWLVPAVDEQGRMLTREETERRFAEGTRSGRGAAYGLFEDIEQARTYRQAHMSHEGRVQMRAALAVAKGIPQERVARDKALAERLGVDPLTVHYAHDEAEERGLEKELEDYEGLQEYASRSQFHAAYVRGDLSQLKAVEDWDRQYGLQRQKEWQAEQAHLETGGWGGEVLAPNTSSAKTWNEALTKSQLQAKQSELVEQWIARFEAGDDAGAEEIRKQIEAASFTIARNAAALGPDESWLRTTKVVPAMLEQAYTSMPIQFKALGAGAVAAGTVLGAGALTGPGVAGAVPLAGTAFKGAALATSTIGTFYLERNLALASMLSQTDSQGNRLPQDIALEAATLYGAVAAGLETISEAAFLNAFKKIEKIAGSSGLVRALAGNAWLRDVAQSLQKDPALRASVRSALSKAGLIAGRALPYVQQAGKVGGAESFTETTQEAANVIAELSAGALANQRDGSSFNTTFNTPENRARIAESAAAGFWAGLGFGAGPVITSAVYHGARARSAANYAQREQERHQVVEQTWTHANDPAALREVLETVAPETQQQVEIPLDRAVQLQQSGVDILAPLGITPEQAQDWAAKGLTVRASVAELHAFMNQEQFNAASQIFERYGESAAEIQTADEELARTLRQMAENGERVEAARAAELWLSPEERTEFGTEVDRLRAEMRSAAQASPNLSAQAEAVGGIDSVLDKVLAVSRRQASIEARRTGQKPADVLRRKVVRTLEQAAEQANRSTEEAVEADIEAELSEPAAEAAPEQQTAEAQAEAVEQPVQTAQEGVEAVDAVEAVENQSATQTEAVPASESTQADVAEAPAVQGVPSESEAAEAESRAKTEAQVAEALSARRITGDESTLIESHVEEPVVYEVWELGDLVPSHDPLSQFAKRDDYPQNVQERQYHANVLEQEKVRRNAAELQPRLLLTDNPDLSNGPSVITRQGYVLGGNSRAMSLQVVYETMPEKAEMYRQALLKKASGFGIAPQAVEKLRQPVLVRVLKADMTNLEMAQASRRYNATKTQALTASDEGVSAAKDVSESTLKLFREAMKGYDTVAEYMQTAESRKFVDALVKDGVIRETDISRLTDKDSGLLNEQGRSLVKNVLRGLVIDDADIVRNAPESVLSKIDRVAPVLVAIKARGGDWARAAGVFKSAVSQINKWLARGTDQAPHTLKNISGAFSFQDLQDKEQNKRSVQAVAMLLAVATEREMYARCATMDAEAENSAQKANAMSAILSPDDRPKSPAGAFVRSFFKPVAIVDGEVQRVFNPDKSETDATLMWASENSGPRHSVEAAREQLRKTALSRKVSPEEKTAAKERLEALKGKTGTVYTWGGPRERGFFGQAFRYRKDLGDVLWQFYGERGVARLDKKEKAARLADLEVARQMETASKDAAAVKLATGWERGADGKWRYEMPDPQFVPGVSEMLANKRPRSLWTILKDGKKNPLLKAYPGLAGIKVQVFADPTYSKARGHYIHGKNIIQVNERQVSLTDKGELIRRFGIDNKDTFESTLYHELQHIIQFEEGFARGGSWREFDNYEEEIRSMKQIRDAYYRDAGYEKFFEQSMEDLKNKKKTIEQHFADIDEFKKTSPFAEQISNAEQQIKDFIADYREKYGTAKTPEEIYLRLMGEVESRNVSRRMDMTPEERRASLASATEDVARKDQILLGVARGDAQMLANEEYQAHVEATTELFQRAWHGSPYKFDRFTLDHIGEGEGAQAHGWGLYFALNREISEDYRESLSGTKRLELTVDGKKYFGEEVEGGVKWKSIDGEYVEKYRQEHLTRLFIKSERGELDNRYLEAMKGWLDNPDLTEEQKNIINSFIHEYEESEIFASRENNGQLYEVEIPDDDVLLGEQTKMKDQPEVVQKAAAKLWREVLGYDEDLNNPNAMFYAYDGRRLYEELADKLGSPEAASLALKEQGVLGITYVGGRDGRCFVIWDEDAIQIYNTLYQAKLDVHQQELEQTPDAFARGAVTDVAGNYFIDLFKRADLSTLFHELGHTHFLSMEKYVRDGIADAEMQADYETLCKWLGATPGEALTVEQHEQLARGWEAYLMEGKAPSEELRGVFQRICEWLLAIYRSVKALGVELNDEVRGVFDRMLATREEIEDAAARYELVDRTTGELQAMGMDPAQMAYTRRVLDAARQAAFVRLREKRDSDRKARLADYRRLAMNELRGEQVHQARSDMRKTPLDLEAVKALMGDEMTARLQKKQPGTFKKEGGIDPGQFAMEHGYESAEAMLADMDSQPTLGRAVAERVDQMSKDYDQQYSAEEALFDSQELTEHASLIARQLAQITGRPYIQQQAVRQVAEQEMSGRQMREAMRVGDFRLNVRRALRDERRAVAQGKFAEALEANTKARINLELVRMSQELRDGVDKSAKAVRRFVGSKSVAEVAKAYLAQIVRQHIFLGPDYADGIVSKYSIEDLTAWQKKLEEDGYTMLIAPDVLATATVWRDMTVEQWQDFADAVRQVVTIERNQRKLLTAQGKKDLDEAVSEIADSLKKHNKAKVNGRAVPDAVRALRRYHTAHMKVEQACIMLDGGKRGPLWHLLYEPINKAADEQAVELRKARDYLRDKLFGMYTKKEFRGLGKKIWIESVGMSLTGEQILCIALNMGNKVNVERVKTGYGWDDAKLSSVLSRLTAKDWQFVQAVWDYLETFREPAFKVHEAVTGSRPRAVEAEALTVQTADGQTLQLRGGYYPIRYDPVENSTQFERDQKAMDQQLFGGRNYGAAQTKQGHLKERAEGGLGTPLLFDFTVLADHVFNVVHDITHRKAVLDVAKIIRNRKAQQAIETYAGREMYQELMPWLQDVANERQAPMSQIQRMAAWARSASTIMQMGYKATTIAMVPFGYTQTIAEIGYGYGLRGYWHALKGLFYAATGQWEKHVAMREFVYSKSPFMRHRLETFDRDIRDFSKQINAGPISGWVDKARANAFLPMGYLQLWAVDMPSWWASYEKGLKENGGNEDDAAAYADSVVRRTQASGATKDLARVQRGSDLHKLLTMFYSYFNTLYNLGAQHIRALKEDHTPAGIWKAANAAILLWFLPSVLSEFAAGRTPEGDDDDEWLKWAAKIWIQVPFQACVFVRDVAGAIFSGFDYQLSPAQSAPASVAKFFTSMYKAIEKQDPSLAVKPTAEAVGYALRLPAKQPIITAQNMWEYCTDPRSEMYLRDIFFVKPKKRQKQH